jgi:PAS domain-containing protein
MPQSVAVMRLQAQLQLAVAHDGERAAMLDGEADRLEEARAKDAATCGAVTHHFGLRLFAPSPVDVHTLDGAAVVVISGDSRDLGLIVTVNNCACRLFGYTRTALERRSVEVLMPEPLACERAPQTRERAGGGGCRDAGHWSHAASHGTRRSQPLRTAGQGAGVHTSFTTALVAQRCPQPPSPIMPRLQRCTRASCSATWRRARVA